MNPDSFLGPVSVIAILLAFFFIAMAYLRHLGAQRARNQKISSAAKPWQVANPYTASDNLEATAPPPATLAPASAAKDAASDPSRAVFRQYGSPASVAAAPDDASTPGYVWE